MTNLINIQSPIVELVENSGHLVPVPGQDLSLLESDNSAVMVVLVTPGWSVSVSYHDDWVKMRDHQTHATYANNIGMRIQVYGADTKDLTELALPIYGSSMGSDDRAFAIFFENASKSNFSNGGTFADFRNNIQKDHLDRYPIPMEGAQGVWRTFRNVDFLLFVKDGTVGNPVHLDTSDLTGISYRETVGPVQYGTAPDYKWWELQVMFRDEDLVYPEDLQTEVPPLNYPYPWYAHLAGDYLKGGTTFSFGFGVSTEPEPPLCNDPAHVPVTITITAHGPVDVQVD